MTHTLRMDTSTTVAGHTHSMCGPIDLTGHREPVDLTDTRQTHGTHGPINHSHRTKTVLMDILTIVTVPMDISTSHSLDTQTDIYTILQIL